MTRRSDIGAAVIGSGFIGTVHIEALRRLGVRVAGLLESSPELGARRAAELGLPKAYASLEDLLADDAVQVVHVTSPNELHYPQVRQILAAGRHVVCEKPLAMTSAESAELVALAAASGLVNAVNFNIRFYPLNQHVAQHGPRGRAGRRPPGHRPLLPGLAAVRHGLELAAGAGPGRRAAGRRRHRLALAGPDQLHRPASGSRPSWPT